MTQFVLRAVLALSFFAVAGNAQVLYGTLTGSVVDSSGAAVVGAAVTATNTGTGQSAEAKTTDTGGFTFPNLTPGSYDLKVAASGFRTYAEKGVGVSLNNVRRVDVKLEVGQVTETVNVNASALTLQTDKTDVNVELDSKAVQNMPLPRYRNYQSLINLVPGATPGRMINSIQAAPARTLVTNVNGVNRNNNATKIDGAVSTFLWLPHHAAYVPPSETIETVNIATNNFDAEQGMAGGAAINVNTKSGTNELHGTVFAYHDNKSLRARNFFQVGPKPNNITNITGFTLGGPIKRGRLFYFGGWEGNRERLGFNTLLVLPTADQRAGDFRAYNTIFDPRTGNAAGANRMAFPGNMIPASQQSATIRKFQDLLPAPTRPGTVANYAASGNQKLNRDNLDLKINWNRNERSTIWGKYSAMDAQVDCPASLGRAGGPGLCQGNPGVADNLTQVATVGFTQTFTPTFLWDGLLGYNRMGVAITGLYPDENFGRNFLGIPGTNGSDPRQAGAPMFVVTGYSALASDTGTRPAYWNDSSFTLNQNFSWVKSAHNIRFGFEGVRHHLNHYQPELGGGPQGRFDFGNGITSQVGATQSQFNAYAAFLMGLPFAARKSLQYEKMTSYNYQYALYFRDRWQVNQRLTFTLGVRWELYPIMTRSGRGGIEVYNPETNQVLLGGAGGNPKHLGITSSKKLFAPRVGFAFKATDRTVIRAGYGMTFNPMPLARPLRGFYPLTIANDFEAPNPFQFYRPVEQGIPDFGGPPLNVGSTTLPPTALMRSISGNQLRRGYVQSWNFVIERELPAGFVGSVGYIGTNTIRSFGDLNINAAAPGDGNPGRPLARRFGRTADTNAWNGFLTANYHSLQLSINRKAACGLTIKGAYTLSKAINFTDEDGWVGVGWNWLPVFNRNRAAAGYDQRHIFQAGYVYELPFGKGRQYATSGAAKHILGGWQVNAVTALFTGNPFTVSAAAASLNAPGNAQTADQVKSEVRKVGGIGPGQEFFDRSAFAAVNQVRFGTSGRNILYGPGVVNLDLGIFRKFELTERMNLEFRAESFNATNTPHFNAPAANVNAANFMQVLSAEQDQRQFRFGLRLAW